MKTPKSFTDLVVMKFRLYSGLFFNLPFDNLVSTGNALSFFTNYCQEMLAIGKSPDIIVKDFFSLRLGLKNFSEISDHIFTFMRLLERQIVLFDAVEDASFYLVRDLDGAGSLNEATIRIEEDNLIEQAGQLLDNFGVRIVLTAHPTQFYTEPVLRIISELGKAIRQNDVLEVNNLLLQLGLTRFKKRECPTPYDEAKAIVWYMEKVLYEEVPKVQQKLLNIGQIKNVEDNSFRSLIELGFWPGGDRDGNPNVTVPISKKIGRLLRRSIINLYIRDINTLKTRLTFDGVIEYLEDISEKLNQSLIENSCDNDAFSSENKYYLSSSELLKDLYACLAILNKNHQGIFSEKLELLIAKVNCFGFYFGIMDLRQDSRVLAKTIDQVSSILNLSKIDYSNLKQDERMKFLANIDDSNITNKYDIILDKICDPIQRDCLEVFRFAMEMQNKNGERSIHRFIISNTNGPADILSLRLLALCAGYTSDNLLFDFVPLFETIDDLKAATKTMETIWSFPIYRKHIEKRNFVQHIMLGFSDGTKDGGYLSANWSIYRAKQALSTLAKKHHITLIFFDGRGGPPARGGGNTHKFYRSLGRDIETHAIHLTIQGQTISSNYGTPVSASYNLEQLASAVLDNYLYPQTTEWHLDKSESILLDELADISQEKYIKLRNHKDFLTYIENLSPLRYYAQANNSSRPPKRNNSDKLKLEDLRAIPFVGAWSQLRLNIPGYFGLGTALEEIWKTGRNNELRKLYKDSLYFRTIIENSMQSLSKVYLPLTSWVLQDSRFQEFHSLIIAEAELTKSMLLAVSGQDNLLSDDPINRESIKLRSELILPMSVLQQYALIHLWKFDNSESSNPSQDKLDPQIKDKEILEKIVVKTMMASVNAGRNSV
jgi:phosphoenolpyruvate carboxylase